MKLIVCLLPVVAVVANAQSFDRDLVVNRLSADLANLKIIPADSSFSLVRGCLPPRHPTAPRPEECGPLDRVREDLDLIHASQRQHFPSLGLAYNLLNSLAGRELDPVPLSVFTNSLVDALVVADHAIEVRTRASGSREFRDSVMRAYTALMALGLEKRDAELILGNLVRNAEQWSRPPDFIPIPPAQAYR
jgi:hypothetical protein